MNRWLLMMIIISKSTLVGVFKLSEMSPVIEFEDLGDINTSFVSKQFVVIAVAILGVINFWIVFWRNFTAAICTSFPPFHNCLISFRLFSDKLDSIDLNEYRWNIVWMIWFASFWFSYKIFEKIMSKFFTQYYKFNVTIYFISSTKSSK